MALVRAEIVVKMLSLLFSIIRCSGFRARKQDRKEKAAEKVAKKMKEEKVRLRAKRKEQMAQMFTAGGLPLPEVEHLVERVEEYEMDGQTVTISTVDSYDAARQAGLCLGPNSSHNSKAMKREEKRKRREQNS